MFLNFEYPIDNDVLKIISDFLSHPQNQESSMSLTQFHGFITAVATAPNMIKSNEWLRILFGKDIIFQSKPQEYLIKNLLFQVNNQTIIDLVSTKEFEPLLFNGMHKIPYKEGEHHLIKEWCRGYFHASQLDELWISNNEAMNQLVPFIILGKTSHFTTHWSTERNFLKSKKRNKLVYQENLPSYIKTLYNFWDESRRKNAFFYDNDIQEKLYQKNKNLKMIIKGG